MAIHVPNDEENTSPKTAHCTQKMNDLKARLDDEATLSTVEGGNYMYGT